MIRGSEQQEISKFIRLAYTCNYFVATIINYVHLFVYSSVTFYRAYEADLNITPSSHHCMPEATAVMNTWKKNSSLLYALWKSFGTYYTLIGLYEVLRIALTFSRPIILR